jgi:DNA-binding MarR family transcriptional regulator
LITSGGLTHRLVRLEKSGLIVRSRASLDRRSLLVQLTDAGAVLAEAAFADDMALESAWLTIFTQAERTQLAALLRKLNSSLQHSEPGLGLAD